VDCFVVALSPAIRSYGGWHFSRRICVSTPTLPPYHYYQVYFGWFGLLFSVYLSTEFVMNHLKTILGLLLVSLMLSGLLLGLEMANIYEGITLYKMNILLSNLLIIFPSLVFFVYLFKQVRNGFVKQGGNVVLLGISVVIVLFLSFFIWDYSKILWDYHETYDGNYTLYPPLSAIPPPEVPKMFALRWFLKAIWITLVFLCLFVGFRIYRNGY